MPNWVWRWYKRGQPSTLNFIHSTSYSQYFELLHTSREISTDDGATRVCLLLCNASVQPSILCWDIATWDMSMEFDGDLWILQAPWSTSILGTLQFQRGVSPSGETAACYPLLCTRDSVLIVCCPFTREVWPRICLKCLCSCLHCQPVISSLVFGKHPRCSWFWQKVDFARQNKTSKIPDH